MFLSYSSSNSRHVEKFCGVILSVHVPTIKSADRLWNLWPSPSPLSRVCHGSKMAENFERLSSFHVLDSILVEKYRSKRTGINFCFAKVPGPLVNGFLCLGKLRAININCRSPLFKLYQTFLIGKKNSGITIISFKKVHILRDPI